MPVDHDDVFSGLVSVLRHVGAKSAGRVANGLGYTLVSSPHLRTLQDSLESVGLSDSKDNLFRQSETECIVDAAQVRELDAKYRAHPLTRLGGLWTETHASYVSLSDFRGDNPFVWQGGSFGDLQYLVTIQHVLAHDRYDLLDTLDEDAAFGATVLEFEGKLYSKDLLDSACEITFLLDHIPLDDLNGSRIVDVGAGYGRLAHRLAVLLPKAQIFCVDGIAVSTATCDAYIRFRQLQSQVTTVPLTELDSVSGPALLATNVHSFSEMSLSCDRLVARLARRRRGQVPVHCSESAGTEPPGRHIVSRPARRSRLRLGHESHEVRRPTHGPVWALPERLLPVPSR